jgi:quercetin dioxygenase-like cupin family protein
VSSRSIHSADGPRSIYLSPDSLQRQPPDYEGTTVELAVSSQVPGAEMFGGVVTIEPGVEIELHYHSQFEFQYVVSGSGIALDATGAETPIAAGGFVLSPAGRAGAHGFRATGDQPLAILFLYPTPGGHTPDRFPFAGGIVQQDEGTS